MKIGILAVQGAFEEHRRMIDSLGEESVLLRQKSDIQGLDGIILPGGESTVQGKLLKELDMMTDIRELIKKGTPVLATCAGLILLADHLSNDANVYFGTLPVTVRRNAYGRQLGSFQTKGRVGGFEDFTMSFIRAPIIESVSKDVRILATVEDHIVAVQYGKQIGLSFHPELGNDFRIHSYFLELGKT